MMRPRQGSARSTESVRSMCRGGTSAWPGSSAFSAMHIATIAGSSSGVAARHTIWNATLARRGTGVRARLSIGEMRRTALALTLGIIALFAAGPVEARVTEGTLLAREKKHVVDLPLEHTEVAIRIAGNIADVEVSQTFTNPYPHKIEAIYAFPLPSGAAIDRLT